MTAAGVPGMRRRVALINPPLTAPTYIATRRTRPSTGSIEKVKGRVRAINIVPVRPGIPPTVIPRVVPKRTSPRIKGSEKRAIMLSFFPSRQKLRK
jgi:hypothetical protein